MAEENFIMLTIWTHSIARAAGVEIPQGRLPIATASPRGFPLVRRLARAWRGWRDRRETLRALQRLDDRLLADIGLSRGMIDGVADGLIRSRPANDNLPPQREPANDNRAARRPRYYI